MSFSISLTTVAASDGGFPVNEKPLAGRTAVVTGASRGIGAAVAVALAGAGARMAIVARSRAALEGIAEKTGGAVVIEADLATGEGANRAASEALDAFAGVPDILVNNAGIFQIAGLADMLPSDFSGMMQTNVVAPFVLLRRLLPGMRERGSGHIVTIGSVADRSIYPGNGAYATTKFAARAMHEVLREETRGSGVRSTLVSPSGVDTEIWDPIRFSDGSSPDRARMLEPGAVAAAVLYALSQPASVNIDELRLSRS